MSDPSFLVTDADRVRPVAGAGRPVVVLRAVPDAQPRRAASTGDAIGPRYRDAAWCATLEARGYAGFGDGIEVDAT